MNLTEKPTLVQWPETHFVFVEKIGPFQETAPKAWQTLHEHMAEIAPHCKILGMTAFYKVQPQMIYCASARVDKKPEVLPEGFKYMKFAGGKYSCFTLKGSYSQLPEACGKVFAIVKDTQLPMREDFFLENYANDPRVVPEDQLLTEILIPTK